MARQTVQLFYNPHAGFWARARTRALRRALEAKGARVLLSESLSGPLAVAPRADQVCAVGGDGTLRHVVEALRESGRSLPLSAYPAGTVNLLARECGYTRDARAFARRLLGMQPPRQHYTALVGQTPLLSCASVGPDSYTVEALSPRLKYVVGRLAYLVAFGRTLFRWRRPRIVLEHDGRQTPCEAVYIAKGRFFAGGWTFAPDASVAEPLLHVVALRQATRKDFLRFALTLARSRPVDALPGATCFTCTELTLRSDDAPPLQADGDIVAHLPASIRIDPHPIPFA